MPDFQLWNFFSYPEDWRLQIYDFNSKRVRHNWDFWFPNIWCHRLILLFPSPLRNQISFLVIPSSVQLLSYVWLFTTPWTTAHQASLSNTNSQSLLKLMSIEWLMPSNHLILCCPLFLLPSILPSIRVFSNESVFCIRWPEYWNFSFSISPSNEYSGLISIRMDWLELLAVQWTSRESSPTP